MINSVTLLGRLGDAPELKYMPSGDAVCNFSLATTEQWRNKNGEKQESTSWHRVTVFGKPAENANMYLRKGSMVFVEGKIKYTTSERDGAKRTFTTIQASLVKFLDRTSPSENQHAHTEIDNNEDGFDESQIPF